MKTCFKCGALKPLAEYYRHPAMADGHLGKCKDCTRKDVVENREKRKDKYAEFDRERAMLPHRVANRKAWTQANREKDRAAKKLQNAVKSGKVVPWPVCAMPECDRKPEAHHPDYGQPLQVVWLCKSHHRQAHLLVRKF